MGRVYKYMKLYNVFIVYMLILLQNLNFLVWSYHEKISILQYYMYVMHLIGYISSVGKINIDLSYVIEKSYGITEWHP